MRQSTKQQCMCKLCTWQAPSTTTSEYTWVMKHSLFHGNGDTLQPCRTPTTGAKPGLATSNTNACGMDACPALPHGGQGERNAAAPPDIEAALDCDSVCFIAPLALKSVLGLDAFEARSARCGLSQRAQQLEAAQRHRALAIDYALSYNTLCSSRMRSTWIVKSGPPDRCTTLLGHAREHERCITVQHGTQRLEQHTDIW